MNLERCPIFGNLSEPAREALYHQLKAVTKTYAKDAFIAHQGDTVHSLYLLSKGSVKTEMITESGGVLAVEIITAPRPLAPAFLFAENNRFPVDVIALEVCEVILIPKTSVMQHLATNEEFLKTYMAFNANRTQFLSERLQLLSIKTIKHGKAPSAASYPSRSLVGYLWLQYSPAPCCRVTGLSRLGTGAHRCGCKGT